MGWCTMALDTDIIVDYSVECCHCDDFSSFLQWLPANGFHQACCTCFPLIVITHENAALSLPDLCPRQCKDSMQLKHTQVLAWLGNRWTFLLLLWSKGATFRGQCLSCERHYELSAVAPARQGWRYGSTEVWMILHVFKCFFLHGIVIN